MSPAAGVHAPLLPDQKPGKAEKRASVSGAVFNVSTSIIGAGIMSIPATLKVIGVIPAFLLILIIAWLAEISVGILLQYTHSGDSTTYAGVMGESFGRIGSIAVQICVLITNLGCLIVYLIIIGDVLSGNKPEGSVHLGVLQEWFGIHWWNSRVFALLFIVVFVMLPLVLCRRVGQYLPFFSFSGALISLFICRKEKKNIIVRVLTWKFKFLDGVVNSHDIMLDLVLPVYSGLINSTLSDYLLELVLPLYSGFKSPHMIISVIRIRLCLNRWSIDLKLRFSFVKIGFCVPESLRYSSAVAVLLALVFVGICSVMAISALLNGKTKTPKLLPELDNHTSFFDLFTAVPVIVTAFTFHFNVHPIGCELEKPSDMIKATRISMVLCALIYFSIGLFGYLLFGDLIMADILVNFDQSSSSSALGSLLNDIVRLSYAFHLMLVFPLINFSLRANIDELVFSKKQHSLEKDTNRFVFLTLVLLAFSYLAAITIPDIWYFFQFLGSTSAVCLGFIFPGAIVLRDVHGISKTGDRIIALIMIILAIVTSSVAISTNIFGFVSNK